MSEIWANITKGAIAENILRLTYLSDDKKLPSSCIQTPTLWLALASLCVLDKDHAERLSSGSEYMYKYVEIYFPSFSF